MGKIIKKETRLLLEGPKCKRQTPISYQLLVHIKRKIYSFQVGREKFSFFGVCLEADSLTTFRTSLYRWLLAWGSSWKTQGIFRILFLFLFFLKISFGRNSIRNFVILNLFHFWVNVSTLFYFTLIFFSIYCFLLEC